MKKSTTKQSAPAISANEQSMAAMYFALSDTAMLTQWDTQLSSAYHSACSVLEAECGVSLDDVYNEWLNTIRSGDSYCRQEWNRVRGKYTKHTRYGQPINRA